MTKPVVIVGAGIAGLTAAAFCAKNNLPVIVLEKSSKAGGLVQSIEREGYVFDLGIRAFENAGILLPMLKSLGIETPFSHNPVSIGYGDHFIDFNSTSNLSDYGELLKKLFPEEAMNIDSIIREIAKITKIIEFVYKVDNPVFEEKMKSLKSLFKYLPWLVKYPRINKKILKLQMPVNDFLRSYTNNESLIDMITQHFFTDTPTFFALSYFAMYPKYFYPKGSTLRLVNEILTYLSKYNVHVAYNSEVLSLDTAKKEVYLENKVIEYSDLIWAADQRILNQSLSEFESIKDKDTTESVLSYSIASESDPSLYTHKIKAHSFYTPSKKGIRSIGAFPYKDIEKQEKWLRDFLQLTTYEISIPVLRDKSLAPKSSTGLIISTLFKYEIEQAFITAHSIEKFKQIVNEEIESVISELFPTLLQHKKFSFLTSPVVINHYTANKNGAISGWVFDQNNQRSFSDTLKAIHTPYDHLYICGQWSFQPAGLPVSILTGKFCVDEILKRRSK